MSTVSSPMSESQKTIDIFCGYDNFSLAIFLLNFFPTKRIKLMEGRIAGSSFVQVIANPARRKIEPAILFTLEVKGHANKKMALRNSGNVYFILCIPGIGR